MVHQSGSPDGLLLTVWFWLAALSSGNTRGPFWPQADIMLEKPRMIMTRKKRLRDQQNMRFSSMQLNKGAGMKTG
jgi:hypothetical protein